MKTYEAKVTVTNVLFHKEPVSHIEVQFSNGENLICLKHDGLGPEAVYGQINPGDQMILRYGSFWKHPTKAEVIKNGDIVKTFDDNRGMIENETVEEEVERRR